MIERTVPNRLVLTDMNRRVVLELQAVADRLGNLFGLDQLDLAEDEASSSSTPLMAESWSTIFCCRVDQDARRRGVDRHGGQQIDNPQHDGDADGDGDDAPLATGDGQELLEIRAVGKALGHVVLGRPLLVATVKSVLIEVSGETRFSPQTAMPDA